MQNAKITIHPRKLTASLHLKMDAWKTGLSFWDGPYLQGLLLLVLGRVLPYTFNFAAVIQAIHRGGVKRSAREIEAGIAGMRSNAASFLAKVGPKTGSK